MIQNSTDLRTRTPFGTSPQIKRDASLLVGACFGLFSLLIGAFAQPVFQREIGVNAVIPLTVVIVFFALIVALSPGIKGARLGLLLILLFMIRLTLSTLHYESYWDVGESQFQSGLTGYDAYRYDSGAYEVVQYGWQNARLQSDYAGIITFYAGIYYVFGHNPLFAVFFNTLLGGLTSLVIFYLVRPFSSIKVAAWSAIITMLIPDSILYGGQLMKEILIMFLFYVALWGWLRFYIRGKYWGLLLFIGATYGLLETRAIYVLVLVASVGLFLIIKSRITLNRSIGFLGLFLGVILIGTFSASNWFQGNSVFSPAFWLSQRARLVSDAVAAISAESANPRSSIGLNTIFDPQSPSTYIFIPFRFLTFYFLPPFWLWGTLPAFVPFVELTSLLSWISIPAMIWGVRRTIRQSRGFLLAIPFLLATLVISASTPFVDIRYKVTLLPLYFLFAVKGFSEFGKWRQLYIPYGIVVVGMIIGYYSLKMILGS